jgi:hypothetical protein
VPVTVALALALTKVAVGSKPGARLTFGTAIGLTMVKAWVENPGAAI